MKRIYIVRHAKSSWADLSMKDHDRPLNARGLRDAPIMVEKLANKQYKPKLMISSSAKRASQTAEIFKDHYKDVKLVFEEGLYHAPEDTYFEVCYGLSEDIDSVMMFGHNPGITYLSNSISDRYIDNVPTCGILIIDTSAESWDKVDPSNCQLIEMLYPKM